MQLSLIKGANMTNFTLPLIIEGNYWITDIDPNGDKRNLVNIEARNNNWVLKGNFETQIIMNNVVCENVVLQEYNFYTLKINNNEFVLVYCAPFFDLTNARYELVSKKNVAIGSKRGVDIYYNNISVSSVHAVISYDGKNWIINNQDNRFGTFVNRKLVNTKILEIGDIIFILGLKIIYAGSFWIINNPNKLVTINGNNFKRFKVQPLLNVAIEEDDYLEVYNENDYFFRSPRFRTVIEREKVEIDPPPEKEPEDDTPIIYTLGPMLTMGMISMVTLVSSLSQVIGGTKTFASSIPSLVIALAMLATMVMWPVLMKRYEKKKKKQKEQERQDKYSSYIAKKKEKIDNLIVKQKQILLENNVTLEQCQDIILYKKRNLWEKDIHHDDFLKVRLGIGNLKPEIDIKYPEEHFTMVEDDLRKILTDTVNDTKDMEQVPISISLAEKNITALVGSSDLTKLSLESILLQLITFHSYVDLKIVMFTNENNSKDFDYLKVLPHCWSDNKKVRFFAESIDEAKQVAGYIEQVFDSRKYKDDDRGQINDFNYKSNIPYFLIIVDDLKMYRNMAIINNILETNINYGFTILIRNTRLSNLPNECSTFINIGGEDGKDSGFFENELVSDRQKMFVADLNNKNIDMYNCCLALANIPMQIEEGHADLPNVLTFLEMYNVGNIEQLNVINRWKNSNPSLSLQVPVGLDEQGELFKLDLHEKFHGPHGLIAGMTGSGKSEFIITYILSLAVNFHPYEVSFVLIDYKGGGLAGAFESKETGIKLPHLAGTITNLDTVEMKRSLDSIQSELRRRQIIFNEAREKLNESTVDIYKYQKYYRDGMLTEPVPHLFIICDEFAELKQQQPDFMAQLISTARIGRSLGVHLILATQKPSGVVDDQIWSNSKFRVCLKVQDKSDSMDMIKCPDAAALKEVGRFYLQVGYNEFFAIGQSAWSGATYFPKEKLKKKIDTSVEFINNIGYPIKTIDDKLNSKNEVGMGEELSNIVKYMSELAKNQNIKLNQLWLDRIEKDIYISDLKKKYNYTKTSGVIEPIIGEYDDPSNQRQDILTLQLSKNGNTLIFGATGSGKDMLLSTIIYSSIITYSVSEVNFYILDFGAETLKMFDKAPHVGDVVLSNEVDKVTNLFKMLNEIIDSRRQLLVKYNGSFTSYNSHNKEKLPTIVVIINNYDVFNELYDEYTDELFSITRDCVKYGIVFIITATSTSSIRYKLRQNFKQMLCLQLNDVYEYNDVFGRLGGLVPSEIYGRGLVKLDNVYEFQTAQAYKHEMLLEYIGAICKKLNKLVKVKALNIPVLPDIVSLDILKPHLTSLTQVPLGIEKESLKTSTYDFKNNYGTVISGLYSSSYGSFVNGLIKEISMLNNVQTLVIDADNFIKQSLNVSYYNQNFDKIFEQMHKFSEDLFVYYGKNNFNLDSLNGIKDTVCFIIGIDKFISKLSSDNKELFKEMIKKSKELKKISFIFVDIIDVFKSLEYEEWYRTAIVSNQGIFLGSGLAEQFTIKISNIPRVARNEIPDGFGFVVNRGTADYVKFLEDGVSSYE